MLEELIYSDKSDFEIIKDLREEIKKYTQNLETEASGKQFFIKYTQKMDEFLTVIFKFVLKNMFGYYRPNINSLPITIVAMGSYSRYQLSLYSDIDVMIVYEEVKGYKVIEIIETFVTMLWDLGLTIGHRVHKLDELFLVSQKDIMIKTALLESRYIYGSRYLWVGVQNELKKIRIDNQKEFVLERYKKLQEGHKKYPLSMEPNIKDGFGGMRDANTLFWIANILYGIKNNSELIGIEYDEKDYKEYRNAIEFIFRVRTHLHIITKKHFDIVLLEYHRDIALKLGYVDTKRLKAERFFIKNLLKSLWTINRFTSIYIKKLLRPFLYNPKTISKIDRVAKNYYICEDTIYINWNSKDSLRDSFKVLLEIDFSKYDVSLVKLFYHQQQANISKNQLKSLFNKKDSYPIIKALYKANKLSQIIPAFAKIKHLAQFDGYHQYPVDIHSIMTLYNVENIKYGNIKKVYDNLDKNIKQILKIVALFHDLGKGRTQDHHLVGEKLIKSFMESLNFKSEEINIAKKLVKYHTTMSNIAQREDIDNDKVLLKFANIVGDKTTLNMLYVLTYADIDAVGNGVFNSFKEYFLTTLYNNTMEIIENKELLILSSKRARKEKLLMKNEIFLSLPKLWQKKVLQTPSSQLFIKNSVSEIANIAQQMFQVESYKYEITTKPLSVVIIKKDINFNLGYFLDKLAYSVRHIAIYKIDNVKYFKIDFEVDDMDKYLLDEVIADSFLEHNEYKFVNPTIKWENFTLDCNHSKNYLALKLKMRDKKGIIANVMQMMDRYKIDVEDIKISLEKGVVRDILIINKNSNFCEIYEQFLEEFR